jgi:3-phenylpropionate/trans-cinnamate dioxygenase ferredoxin reductase subunit
MADDKHTDHLLIGGGLASVACAEMLRRRGAEGSILIVGREPDLPYDRPPCSKGYLRGEQSREDTLLHDTGWYEEREIEVLTRTSVTALDPRARTARLSDRRELTFGQALLATGAGVRRLRVEGAELEGIHYLRTLGNSDTIRADAAGKRVVLIGGSYIACELAASLTQLGSECSLVMLEVQPLSRHFGAQAGGWFLELLESHGVRVHGSQSLQRFEGAGGRVTRVVTESGMELEADAVIMGVGAVPDVALARAAGLELGKSGGVAVDARLQSGIPGVFAAGDIAEYPSVLHGGGRLRLEHWDVAFNQGRFAALNMLGAGRDYDVVPYFFSDLADWASLEYVGPAETWERELIRGTPGEGSFTIFYLREDRVVAALAVGRSEDLQAARRLIAEATPLGAGVAGLADLDTDLDAVTDR